MLRLLKFWCSLAVAVAYPSNYLCDYACLSGLSAGGAFGRMGISNFGSSPTGANCEITTDIPTGGYTAGVAYTVTVTSTTALARKLGSSVAGFSASAIVNAGSKVTSSSHQWTATSDSSASFKALCGAGGSVDQMWVADTVTYSIEVSACNRPVATGYDLTACAATIAMAGWSPSCGSCSAGYTGSVTHTVCSSAGTDWSVDGCQPVCNRPSATGYDLTACAATIAMAGWSPSCGSCSAGYTGSVTHTVCSSAGTDWSVGGCQPACNRPSATGYDLTACAATIAMAGWSPSCGSCSAGYTGSVTHTVCSSAGTDWSVDGCQATTSSSAATTTEALTSTSASTTTEMPTSSSASSSSSSISTTTEALTSASASTSMETLTSSSISTTTEALTSASASTSMETSTSSSISTTTEAPTSTFASTTTGTPLSSSGSTTTEAPTSTSAPTTTDTPTSTSAPTTTQAPTSTSVAPTSASSQTAASPTTTEATETISGSLSFTSTNLTKNVIETAATKSLANNFSVPESQVGVSASEARRLEKGAQTRMLASTWTVSFTISVASSQAAAAVNTASSIQSDTTGFSRAMKMNLQDLGVSEADATITVTSFEAVLVTTMTSSQRAVSETSGTDSVGFCRMILTLMSMISFS